MQSKYSITLYDCEPAKEFKVGDFWVDSEWYKNIVLNREKVCDEYGHYKIIYNILRDKVKFYGTERHISKND